jgi:DNA polymerase-3 subunit delta
MAKLSVEAALSQIENNNIAPIYTISGKENFFSDQIIDALTRKIFPSTGAKDLNYSVMHGTEHTLKAFINNYLAMPMLAEKKLLIVKSFNAMSVKGLQDEAVLIKYLKQPQANTVLALLFEDGAQKKIYQTIRSISTSIACDPIPEYKVAPWLISYVKRNGFSINPDAAQFLVSNCGSHLLTLVSEFEKLRNFKNNDTNITVEDIEQTSGFTKEMNVFALQKALSVKNLPNSLRIGKYLIDSGDHITRLNSTLFSFFRKALVVASLREQNMDKRQISAETKLSDFQLREINTTLQKFNTKEIKRTIQLMHELDVNIKTTNINQYAAMQMLCYKICKP